MLRRHLLGPSLAIAATLLLIAAVSARPSSSSRVHIPFVTASQTELPELTSLRLEPVVGGLDIITDIAHAGDGRLFIVERTGRIHILQPDGTLAPQPFLDLHSDVNTLDLEEGMLGLAFHPDYASNGYFYVAYTPVHDPSKIAPLLISRFSVNPTLPDSALRDSQQTVLLVDAAARRHHGGSLRFAPDGTLYIGTGDGTDAQLAQDMTSLRGKVLRIDVGPHDTAPYLIPPDNPFANSPPTRPEIWAAGARNPYRIAFDRQTGTLFVADVGLNLWEEINVIAPGDGGHNYGWPCMEGWQPLSLEPNCLPHSQFTPPTAAYQHEDIHCAVIGGGVYRGSRFPILSGHYFLADFCSGAVWAMAPPWTTTKLLVPSLPVQWTAAGEDAYGELYFAGESNGSSTVFRLAPGP